MHKHRKIAETVRPFSGPVSERQNPVAHGNVCYVESCSCSATRRTNSNAGQVERGPWVAAMGSNDRHWVNAAQRCG